MEKSAIEHDADERNLLILLGNADDVLSIILLSAGMLSLVISIVGIKLRWFRHRLTLEQAPTQVESPVLLRTTSETEYRENCARGVYRQSTDAESMIFLEQPAISPTNGKKKTKNSEWLQVLYSDQSAISRLSRPYRACYMI